MGSPNSGPFSYVAGSLQLYIEALNFHSDESKIINKHTASSKNSFVQAIDNIDSTMKHQTKGFLKRTSSSYTNFSYEEYSNGLRVIRATKPGNVPGSKAEYVKIMYKDGTIRAMYKDTTDHLGNKVHRHIKWPIKEI